MIRKTKKDVSKFRENIPLYLEVYKNASWQTMVELLVFKIRDKLSLHFESGLLIRKPKNLYDLIYYDGTNRYVVRFPKVRGPSKILQVLDEKHIDVTDKIKEYGGPSHNFHGIPTTPEMLGYTSLAFIGLDGTTMDFRSGDIISI